MSKDTEQFFIDSFTRAGALYKEKKFLESLTLYKELLSIKPNQINILNNITKEEEHERRENCIKIYNHFKDYYDNING